MRTNGPVLTLHHANIRPFPNHLNRSQEGRAMMKPVIPSTVNTGNPVEFACDWGKVARLIVHDSLKTQPGERVIIHADPTYFPARTHSSAPARSGPERPS